MALDDVEGDDLADDIYEARAGAVFVVPDDQRAGRASTLAGPAVLTN